MSRIIWPEVFTDEDFEYEDTPRKRLHAVADALTGWANCQLGIDKPPAQFGRGMVKIAGVVGCGAITPDNVMQISRDLQQEEDESNLHPWARRR